MSDPITTTLIRTRSRIAHEALEKLGAALRASGDHELADQVRQAEQLANRIHLDWVARTRPEAHVPFLKRMQQGDI